VWLLFLFAALSSANREAPRRAEPANAQEDREVRPTRTSRQTLRLSDSRYGR